MSLKTRSLPNVETYVLVATIRTLHFQIHTIYGLLAFDETRRAMIDRGIKLLKIRAELDRRGASAGLPECRFCA